MAELKDIYRISRPSGFEDLTNQFNRILSRLSDRLDKIEGFRGTPEFYADINLLNNRITGLSASSSNTDGVNKGEVDDSITDAIASITLDGLSDVVLSSQEHGDIVFRGASYWVNLHHGNSGQVLTSGGHGADPSWADTAGGDWITDTDSWKYYSSTAFKIEGKDVQSRFPVGCKISLTQTTEKFFNVISTSFSTDTIVNVTGGSDFSVANAPITNPKYSYALCPTGFPHWFHFEPTWTGFSSAPSGLTSRFRISGRMVQWYMYQSSGTSNANTCSCTLPVQALTHTNYSSLNLMAAIDNSNPMVAPGYGYITSGATTVTFYRQINEASTTWTTSGSKNMIGWICYEI